MVKTSLKKVDVSEQEISAFVNQQMAELEPHIDSKTPVEVSLIEGKKGFQVSLTAVHPEGKIQTVGTDEDLFNAIRNAKEGLLDYCVEIEAETNPQFRDSKIDQILKNKNHYLH